MYWCPSGRPVSDVCGGVQSHCMGCLEGIRDSLGTTGGYIPCSTWGWCSSRFKGEWKRKLAHRGGVTHLSPGYHGNRNETGAMRAVGEKLKEIFVAGM